MDDLKKGMDDLARGIDKAVGQATSPSAPPPAGGPPPPPGSAPPPPPGAAGAPAPPPGGAEPVAPVVDDWDVDVTDPGTWVDEEQLAELVERRLDVAVAFGSPQRFEAGGLEVARFTSTDGAVTVDVATYLEPHLLALGSQEAVCADALAGLPGGQRLSLGFDDGVLGSKGPGHGAFVGCLGDAVGRVDVYGPPGPALTDVAGDVLAHAFRVA